MGEAVDVDVRISEPGDATGTVTPIQPPTSAEWRAAYPSAGYRILGAARLWSTIHYFAPYKPLIGEDWDAQVRATLPAVENARDSVEYAKAIAAFATRIHDTHVTVNSATLRREVLGALPIGAAARLIENQLVITRIADSNASRAGLRVGDVVLSIDGEAIGVRIARLTPYLPVSTTQSLRYRLQTTLLNGRDTTSARLVVRGATGGDRTLTVPRSQAFFTALQKHRTGSIIRLLPGNIGYIDLDRLPAAMVDSAFRVLANTTAIIFDDRGYPLGTAWPIAPRLNTHAEGVTAAKFRRLIVPSPDTARTTVYAFDQPIPPSNGVSKYTGRTVMMVDERTISQAEHTGLFFEAANSTTFIGSPTMGANGDVTNFILPGMISISFTGHDVRHADGRQLQRVGLEPKVAVTPTIAGIRAGRDEVLEAAFKYVGGTGEIPADTAHEPPPPPARTVAPGPRLENWFANGTTAAYVIGADRGVAHGGSASGHVASTSSVTDGFGALTQVFRADQYRGKRVRFSAFVKTKDATTGAGLWVRVDGNGGVLAFDNMSNRYIRGTTDWTKTSIVLDVPTDAVGVAIGLLMPGSGDAWIDDASFEVVGSDVASTNMMPPAPNPAEAEQQRRRYANAPAAPSNLDFEHIP
jgi:C-terminal processing protease CtpA/Prc